MSGLSGSSPGLKYDIQPRVVSRGELKHTGGPLSPALVPNLKVLVTNPSKRPLMFTYGCGGQVPVQVAYENGEQVQEALGIACTMEARVARIQPGQTLSFPSFQWQKLMHLRPGKYLWVYGKQTFPFTLKP